MTVQPWAERYRTGIARIDQHHDEVFELMDEAYNAIIGQQGRNVVEAKVTKVIALTLDHFSDEEREMQQANYDGAAHIASHQALRDQLNALTARLATGNAASSEALEVMSQYLTQHIRTHDARLAKHLGV